MSRPRKELDRSKEAGEVLRRIREEPAGWMRERLLAIKIGLEGELTLEEIARNVGHARATIQNWFERYRSGGIKKLLAVNRGKGPASWLSPDAEEALRRGLTEGRWRTARQAHEFLSREHGLKVKLETMYKYLGKCEARLRVPRPSHLKKDPATTEAFKANLAQKIQALNLPARRQVRLWITDEMRCGLHTQPRRVWGLPGIRPVMPVQQKYQWQYVYGALEIGPGGAEFFYGDSVGLEWNQNFLEQIAARDPGSIHVVIYDGAGFHHRDGHQQIPKTCGSSPCHPTVPNLIRWKSSGISSEMASVIESLPRSKNSAQRSVRCSKTIGATLEKSSP